LVDVPGVVVFFFVLDEPDLSLAGPEPFEDGFFGAGGGTFVPGVLEPGEPGVTEPGVRVGGDVDVPGPGVPGELCPQANDAARNNPAGISNIAKRSFTGKLPA